MELLVFFMPLLILPLFTLRKRKEENEEILDYNSSLCLKGVLCLFVMFHNLGLDYEGNNEIMEIICEHAGGVSVGLFFFLSAFGIVKSYQKHGNKYLKKLLLVNALKLYLISVLINLLTYFVFLRGNFEMSDLLMRIFNFDVFNDFNRMNRHGWFISTLIFMYFAFALIYYLCSKLETDKKFIIAAIIISIVAIGLRITARVVDKGGMYTRELPTFAIGVMYATFYNQFNKFFSKNYFICLIALLLLTGIGYFLFEPLSTYSAALLIITISQKYTYQNNITMFLGKICIGMYLFLHFSTLALQEYVVNPYWWVLLNVGFILELSLLLYGLQVTIEKLMKKIMNACKCYE